MSKPAILIVGAGGHAAACIDVIEQSGQYTIAGAVGLPADMGSVVAGIPVVGSDADLSHLRSIAPAAIVAVGQITTPAARIRLYTDLVGLGFAMPAIVSPRAYVSPHARIGDGTIVLHGAVINARASVGRNCIINSLALVEHDAEIADHCHVATHAALNSGVRVGPATFIGSGARVRQGISIGANCVIGMGELVFADCPDGTQLGGKRR
jgi:sugar O-acyltransferase (sialic acid O-acetyltransferase NeuD family)